MVVVPLHWLPGVPNARPSNIPGYPMNSAAIFPATRSLPTRTLALSRVALTFNSSSTWRFVPRGGLSPKMVDFARENWIYQAKRNSFTKREIWILI